ncbi:NDR1/HIN1-like protein 6 [Impatiens glandulifera]|uniref:NDR1/HIN1-like protein 6 n=1 Tax=Impatiens glandulifera TaxID=253017 RepID=UPI001FB0DF83|nr:NDR1/HIN1-like protein 6 [Impatiens glandulifera]
MTDRVYPSKPNAAATTTNAPAPTKTQIYKPNPNPHPYRPVNHQTTANRRRRGRRGCFCLCCFWSILILTILLFLIAIASCVFYLLYTPNRPSFTINSLRISRFNLTTSTADDTTHLAAAFNLTISAKNRNKKISFFYDHISITAETSKNEVVLANASFPNFNSNPRNTTVIRSFLATSSEIVDSDSVASLKSDLKKKTGIPIKIVVDTGLVVKMDNIKSKRILIRVTCDGIHGVIPKGKPPAMGVVASTAGSKCKVNVRIKIWKWTF